MHGRAYQYDPEGAKKLLEDNGLSGLTLKLYTFAKYIPVAEVMQANLAQAGINLEITEYAQTGFTKAIKEDNKYDLAINCTSQYGGIMTVMVEYLMTNAARSFMNYSNPEFDAKLTDALASPNYEEMLTKVCRPSAVCCRRSTGRADLHGEPVLHRNQELLRCKPERSGSRCRFHQLLCNRITKTHLTE